jgi:hypothetical protein
MGSIKQSHSDARFLHKECEVQSTSDWLHYSSASSAVNDDVESVAVSAADRQKNLARCVEDQCLDALPVLSHRRMPHRQQLCGLNPCPRHCFECLTTGWTCKVQSLCHLCCKICL